MTLQNFFISAGVVDFQFYLVGAIFSIISPGPNNFYALLTTIEKGWRFGFAAIIGLLIGDSILLLCVSLGMGSILISYVWLNDSIILFGASFLIWLGYGSIKQGLEGWSQASPKNKGAQTKSSKFNYSGESPFFRGLIIALINPLGLLFYVAFFPQFISTHFPRPDITLSFLSVVMIALEIIFFSLLLFFGNLMATRETVLNWFRARQHYISGLEIFSGLIFILYGGRLLFRETFF